IMNIIDTELSDVQRRTILLYYYNGLTVAEIAGVMDCPEGTVMYRLHAAREKIREAVLIYEKEHDDRLHAIVPIPVLTRIFRAEAEQISLPDIRLDLNNKANHTSAKNITQKAGGSTMKNAIVGKIIAGAAAIAVIGGGITAAVLHNSNSDSKADENSLSVPATEKGDNKSDSFDDEELNENTTESKANADSDTGSADSGDNESAYNAVPLDGLAELKGTIEFGHWEQDGDESNGPEPIVWRIYEKKDGKAFFWSHMVLDYAPFSAENCSWENSDIRSWLNGEFYENAFTDEEKSHIFLSEIDNETAPNTKDHVFLPTPFDATADRFHQDHQQEMSLAAQKRYAELTGKENTHASYWSRIIGGNEKPYYIYTLTTSTDDASKPYGIIPCIYVAYDHTPTEDEGASASKGEKLEKLSDYFNTDNFDSSKFKGFYTKKGELMSDDDFMNQATGTRHIGDQRKGFYVYLSDDHKNEDDIFNKDKETISTLEYVSEMLGDPTCIYECQNKLVESEESLSWNCYAFWIYGDKYICYHTRLYDGGVEQSDIYPLDLTTDYLTMKNTGMRTSLELSQYLETFRNEGYTVYGTPLEEFVPTV
ncbi:MAG: RNA polymerase sigma factor, partial [Ruminococcus sp.]|nr:RNA polymerase sigma factor [Ruminococcus sp.]